MIHLEITEVILVHCNIVNNDYQLLDYAKQMRVKLIQKG